MSIVAAFDKTLFYNETSKYCVLRLKTADLMIPEDARTSFPFGDHLIRFTAVGYDLPRTDSIKMELEGTWTKGKYGCQLQVDRWHEIVPPTIEGIRGYLSSGLLKGIGEKTADAIIAYSKTCGRTGHHYKDGLAFKFEDDLFETKLQYIEWTPSRTGEIAPVAVFEPVEIDGCTVSRASLHNLSFIEGLELMPGNRVLVSKRNMIIPHVEENLDRGGFCMEQAIPGQCPCCGQPTRIHENNDTKTLFCDNPDCETRRLRKFVHFASQKAMDIEGLSEATIERLVGKLYRGLVQNAIAQCLGVPNLWNVKSKPDESRAFLETAEHSLHYPDYEYSYSLVSLLNGTPTDRKLTIGSRSLCTCCGQPHNDSSSLKCGTCESVIVCKECGSTVSRDSAHYMDGAFFCQDCVAQCELCGSWIRGAEVHQAISRSGRIVRLCEHCHTSATGTCDLCSSREICQIINAGRFCPHTEYAVAAAA